METVSEQSVNHDERRQAAKGAGDEMTAAGKAEGKAARETGGSGKSGAKAKPGERYERGTRSYTMSHIRGKDTRIEVLVRRYLFSRGLRFRKTTGAIPAIPTWFCPDGIRSCSSTDASGMRIRDVPSIPFPNPMWNSGPRN